MATFIHCTIICLQSVKHTIFSCPYQVKNNLLFYEYKRVTAKTLAFGYVFSPVRIFLKIILCLIDTTSSNVFLLFCFVHKHMKLCLSHLFTINAEHVFFLLFPKYRIWWGASSRRVIVFCIVTIFCS